MITMQYAYGAKTPHSPYLERINKSLDLAYHYFNKLIDIERWAFDARAAAQQKASPDLAGLLQSLKELDQRVEVEKQKLNQLRAKLKTKRIALEYRKPLLDLNEARKEMYSKVSEEKAKLKDNEEYKKALVDIYNELSVRQKTVYGSYPDLFWGTKNAIRADVDAAVDRCFGSPQFKKRSRSGRLSCQIINGINAEEIFSCKDTRVQIERVLGHKKKALFRMRIGSDENRKPVWAELMIYFHRPFPVGSQIMSAQIIRRPSPRNVYREGKFIPIDEWKVCFSVRIPEEKIIHPNNDCIAIDTGWRRVEQGLRVAVLYDRDRGEQDSLILPNELLARWAKSEDIQSVRDQLFNTAHSSFIRFMKDETISKPDWLTEACGDHLHQWKSPRRFRDLVAVWKRFPGDEEIWNKVFRAVPDGSLKVRDLPYEQRSYIMVDRHLEQYGKFNAIKADAIRNDLYRNFAIRIARKYGIVLMKDTNFAEMYEEKPPEKQSGEEAVAIRWRKAASNGLLRRYIREACVKTASSFFALEAQQTTAICSECGSKQTPDRAIRTHTCSDCSQTWDLDVNACKNLLAQFQQKQEELFAKQQEEKDKAQTGGKWARRKAKKAERENPEQKTENQEQTTE